MMGSVLLLATMASHAGECRPKAPPGMVARAAPFGGVIEPTAADAEEAVAGGIIAQRAARRFLGLDPPPFLIAARSAGTPPRLGGCAFLFPWSFSPIRAGASPLPTHVLPHEIGHALFIRFLVPRTRADEYGGDAPDWLDEMAAIAFEDAGGVRMRRAEARRHAERGALMPLARLLSMTHPEWSARKSVSGAPARSGMTQPSSPETPAFYATVRALLDFLIDRTGNERVIRVLSEQVRAGAPLDRWLLEHCAPGADGAEGLHRLDAQIVAFVLTNRAFNAARTNIAAEKES
jgi:hypothetical protein